MSPVIAANVAGYRPDASDRNRPSARGECRLQSDLPAAMRQIDARHIVVVVHGPEGKCEQGGRPPGHARDVPAGTMDLALRLVERVDRREIGRLPGIDAAHSMVHMI